MSSTAHVSDDSLRKAYELAEQENDKARRIILWCAQHLPKDRLPDLIKMVKEGIVEDTTEETREYLLKLIKAVNRLTELVEEGVNSPGPVAPLEWWGKVDAQAGQVRGLVQELDLPPTLHELRSGLLT